MIMDPFGYSIQFGTILQKSLAAMRNLTTLTLYVPTLKSEDVKSFINSAHTMWSLRLKGLEISAPPELVYEILDRNNPPDLERLAICYRQSPEGILGLSLGRHQQLKSLALTIHCPDSAIPIFRRPFLNHLTRYFKELETLALFQSNLTRSLRNHSELSNQFVRCTSMPFDPVACHALMFFFGS